jgi:hypothetical protein
MPESSGHTKQQIYAWYAIVFIGLTSSEKILGRHDPSNYRCVKWGKILRTIRVAITDKLWNSLKYKML